MSPHDPLQQAITLATEAATGDGGPFGAVLVAPGGRAFTGTNSVTASTDPTAHAEIVAIRSAAATLGTADLTGCVLYASCEPCPMCLTAGMWARVDRVVHAATRGDAAAAGFDDEEFHRQLRGEEVTAVALVHEDHPDRLAPFAAWAANEDRVPY